MNDKQWVAWKIITATTWQDIKDVLTPIHIDFIDHDHQILVNMALRLNVYIDRMEMKYSLETLDQIKTLFEELYQYAVHHFEREEQFMDRHQLPDSIKHKAEHEQILKTLSQVLEAYKKGKITASQTLKKDIMRWLIGHINEFDVTFFRLENWQDHLVKARDWSDVMEIIALIGIKSVDEEHRTLTQKAINMFEVLEGKHYTKALASLDDFAKFCDNHFANEKNIMETYGMDENDHLAQHRKFNESLKTYKKSIEAKQIKVSQMKLWVLDWWISHINGVDAVTFKPGKWLKTYVSETDDVNKVIDILRKTGIPFIDRDHESFIRLVYNLIGQINNQNSDNHEAIVVTLNELRHLVGEHFTRENKLMDSLILSDRLIHQGDHQEILSKLDDILKHFNDNKLMASNNLKSMLLDWWLTHTNTIDYKTFVVNVSEDQRIKLKEVGQDGY